MRPVISLAAALAAATFISACSADADGGGSAPEETPADETAFYVGTWAADPTWCTDQSEGFPITIEPTRFNGRENICEMSGIEDTPEGGVTAQLSCVAEGDTVEEPIIFTPADDQLAITWPDRGQEATLFTRCD